MANFKNLEMAAALSNDSRIEIRKSLFGTKVIYSPTQSQLEAKVLEYTPDAGARMERMLAQPFDKLRAEVEQKGAPKSTPVGQYRLEACLSKDGGFAALQLFRFSDFVYHQVSDLIIAEGADVSVIRSIVQS